MRLVTRRVAVTSGIVGAMWMVLAALGALGDNPVVGVMRTLILSLSVCLTVVLVWHLLGVKLVTPQKARLCVHCTEVEEGAAGVGALTGRGHLERPHPVARVA